MLTSGSDETHSKKLNFLQKFRYNFDKQGKRYGKDLGNGSDGLCR